MKKYSLLKIIGLMFLVVVVLTWIIPNGGYTNGKFVLGDTAPAGIFDLPLIPLMSLASLLQYGLLIVLIGGLYGVINKTGVYSNLINKIVSKLKGKEKIFIIITIITLSLISSFLGLSFSLLIIVPFLITIMIKLGLSKVTSLVSSIGSILIGNIGAIYSSDINYHINSILLLNLNDEIFTKIIFLILIVFLLIMFVLKDMKQGIKVKKNTKKENKEELILPLYEENKKKKSAIPLIVIFLLSFIFLSLNMINWEGMFNVTFFKEIYNNIMSIKIGNYPIVSNILGSVQTFGAWSLYDMCIFLIIMTIIIGWLYSLKLEEFIDGLKCGVKEMLVPAFYVTIANIIFITLIRLQSSSNIYYTMTNGLLGVSDSLKVIMMPVVSLIGGFFFNDMSILMGVLESPITILITDTTKYPLIGMIIQMIHGIVMFILPTSMLLITGLSYLKISYKEWIKYIWKYVIQILLVSLAIIMIVGYFI